MKIINTTTTYFEYIEKLIHLLISMFFISTGISLIILVSLLPVLIISNIFRIPSILFIF